MIVLWMFLGALFCLGGQRVGRGRWQWRNPRRRDDAGDRIPLSNGWVAESTPCPTCGTPCHKIVRRRRAR